MAQSSQFLLIFRFEYLQSSKITHKLKCKSSLKYIKRQRSFNKLENLAFSSWMSSSKPVIDVTFVGRDVKRLTNGMINACVCDKMFWHVHV